MGEKHGLRKYFKWLSTYPTGLPLHRGYPAKKFPEISPDRERNLHKINEKNIPSCGTKCAAGPIELAP